MNLPAWGHMARHCDADDNDSSCWTSSPTEKCLIDVSRQRKHMRNIIVDPVNANYSILLCKGPIKPMSTYDEWACIDGETTL
jgi:hypothetical protein